MKKLIIAILVAVVLVFAFLFFTQKKSNVSYEPWPETEPAHTTQTNNNPNGPDYTPPTPCAPSIVVTNPTAGASYTTGQQVTIKWTSCGVQNVVLAIVSGGKDHGEITPAPIPASLGSYQWAATNPSKAFTDLNTNSNYQIVVESYPGGVMARSGVFSVTTPPTSSNLENIETPLFIKSVYQKNGKWWADVDYVTKVSGLEHVLHKINSGACVIPGMTKNQMLSYADNTINPYMDQDNLIVVHCGYSPYELPISRQLSNSPKFINQNPMIRSFPFAANFNGHENYNEACGGEPSFYTPEFIKMDIERDNNFNVGYLFDVYETRGYFQDMVIIENSVIKKFNAPAGCPG